MVRPASGPPQGKRRLRQVPAGKGVQMCGVFHFTRETFRELKRQADIITDNIKEIREKDIRPSELSTILIDSPDQKGYLAAEDMRWGFKSFDKKLMINARAETALEKRSFADSVRKRRCIIPAKHFYEWNRNKEKVTFSRQDSSILYMAGFYRQFDDDWRFIILTTAANDSMKDVHDRMPLILNDDTIRDWIRNDDMVEEYLAKNPPMLRRYQEYEQLTLF